MQCRYFCARVIKCILCALLFPEFVVQYTMILGKYAGVVLLLCSVYIITIVFIIRVENEKKDFLFHDGSPCRDAAARRLRKAGARIGYEAVFHQINWNEKDSLLASGEVDCLWGCFSMNGREDDYLWAGPYAYSIQSVAVLANSDINTFSDLESKRVAVQMSSKAESIFSDMTDERIPEVINIYCMLNTDEMATALRKCYVDACAGHEFALRDALNEAGIEFRILDEDLLRSELGVAFSLDGDAALRDKLAAVLEEMRSDGTMEQIFSRYDIDVEKSLGRAE